MNKIFNFFIQLVIIFSTSTFISAADKRSHSEPALETLTDDVSHVRRVASYPQIRQMAEIEEDTMRQRKIIEEERKRRHKLSESGLFSNMEETDRDITCSLIFLLSAFNVYQSFQSLTIPEFGMGILGFCGLTYLSLKKIHEVDAEHQKKFGVEHCTERKEPVPSFWYQSQYVYYAVLGALFCASLINLSEHDNLAYLITLGCFNGMLSTCVMTFLNRFSIMNGDGRTPFPMLSDKQKSKQQLPDNPLSKENDNFQKCFFLNPLLKTSVFLSALVQNHRDS